MYPNNKGLLVAVDDIKRVGILDVNIDENVAAPAVKLCQDKWILPIVGSRLFEKLILLVENGEIYNEQYECYKELLDGYIFYILAWSVKAELVMLNTEKVRNIGNVRVSDDRSYPNSFNDHRRVARYYNDNADMYKSQLGKYLSCSCSCFPELSEITAWWEKKPETVNTKHSFIYFGKGKYKCGCDK